MFHTLPRRSETFVRPPLRLPLVLQRFGHYVVDILCRGRRLLLGGQKAKPSKVTVPPSPCSNSHIARTRGTNAAARLHGRERSVSRTEIRAQEINRPQPNPASGDVAIEGPRPDVAHQARREARSAGHLARALLLCTHNNSNKKGGVAVWYKPTLIFSPSRPDARLHTADGS